MSFGLFYFPLQLDEPVIKITPQDSEHHVNLNETVKLHCTALRTDSTNDLSKLDEVQWFGPFNNKCKAESPLEESRLSCTVTVRVLTNKEFGTYTCKATNHFQHCSTKTIQLLKGK